MGEAEEGQPKFYGHDHEIELEFLLPPAWVLDSAKEACGFHALEARLRVAKEALEEIAADECPDCGMFLRARAALTRIREGDG